MKDEGDVGMEAVVDDVATTPDGRRENGRQTQTRCLLMLGYLLLGPAVCFPQLSLLCNACKLLTPSTVSCSIAAFGDG